MQDFIVTGPLEHVNPYMEKMIKFWMETKKNLYQFLLTLDFNELASMSNSLIEDFMEEKISNENTRKWADIGRSIAIMGYSIEKGRHTGQFSAKIEEFCDAARSFSIMSGMAASEKLGQIKLEDNSYFFDPKINLQVKILDDRFMEK